MAELIYKKLKKDLEQKALVSADPATTALVVTKSEFIEYKDQTQQTLNQMTAATAKAQEGVDSLVQGKTPVKGLVVYREENTDKNGIAITENSDSNLAIYKVNADGSASNVKLLLNDEEVALKNDVVLRSSLNVSVTTGVLRADRVFVSDFQIFSTPDFSNRSNRFLISPVDEDSKLWRIETPGKVLQLQTATGVDTITTNSQLSNYLSKILYGVHDIKGRIRYGEDAAAAISDNKDLVTKEYVDGKVAGIPQPDLTPYAKLSATNTFTVAQTFNGRVYVNTEPQATNEVATKQYVDSKSVIDETTNQWFKTDRTYKGKPVYKLIATADINFTTGVGVENWVFRNLPNVPVSVPVVLTCKTIIVYGSWQDMTQGTQIAENVLHTTQFSISAYYSQVLNSVRAVLTSGSLPEKKNMTFTFIMEVA